MCTKHKLVCKTIDYIPQVQKHKTKTYFNISAFWCSELLHCGFEQKQNSSITFPNRNYAHTNSFKSVYPLNLTQFTDRICTKRNAFTKIKLALRTHNGNYFTSQHVEKFSYNYILENVAYISSKKAGQFLEAWQSDKLAISRHTEINYIYKPFRKEQLKAKGNSPDHILPHHTHITNHPDKQEPEAKSDQPRRRNALTTARLVG